MTPILIAPRGGPVDACWHEGRIVVAYQDGPGPDALLVQRSYTPQGSVLSSVTYPLGSDVGAFPRLLSALESVWLIYREGASLGGRAVLRRDGAEMWRSPAECGGNDPVCLGGSLFGWQQSGDNLVRLARLTEPDGQWAARRGAPTGLSHIDAEQRVVLVDEARGAQSGMTRPSWAGTLVAGEHPDSGALVVAADGRRLHVWPGEDAYTPRLAHDPQTGRYAVVTWGRQGVRLAVFDEADLVAPAPVPSPVWDTTGTVVDCGRFFDVQGATVPREAADGQCWQAIRHEQEIRIVKGGDPRMVEILRLTDDDVRLAYDATDGRYPRAWRLDVLGDGRSDAKWCPLIGVVGGWRAEYPDATLVRRTEGGPSTREPFPYLVGVEAHGRHIDYGGDVGVVDAVMVMRYEPHAGKTADGYHELHHYAVKAGRAIGLVRYVEIRHGKVAREFTFNRHAPGRSVSLSSLIVHPIPDPPADAPPPDPEPDPMPTLPTHLTLRSAHGRYLCAESGGGTFVVADRETAREWETWRVVPGHTPTTVALQASDGHYLCAHEGGGSYVIADRQRVGPWESWRVERHGDGIALRADVSGLYLCAEFGGSVTATRTEAHAWEIWTPTKVEASVPTEPDPPTDPLPDPGPSQVLPVVVDGRILRTSDGAALDYREASFFMVLARWLGQNGGSPQQMIDAFRACRGMGINTLRGFVSIGHPDFWQSRGWLLTPRTPGIYKALHDCTVAAAAEGIRMRWTLLADTGDVFRDTSDVRGHVIACMDALRGLPCIIEVCNEPTMNGYGSDWAVVLADLARSLDESAIVALGPEHGATGHLATADRAPADVVFFHAERRTGESGFEWLRRLGEYGVVRDGKRPVLSGEPINAGDEGAPGDYQNDPAIWFCYGALSRMVPSHGYAPTFHYHGGLWADLPNQATRRCLDAFIAGCNAVPLSVREWAWTNGHHGESPWRGYDQTDPPSDNRPSRIYGRRSGGTYWGVSIREPKGWAWPDLRYPVERVASVDGERFDCSVWKGQA